MRKLAGYLNKTLLAVLTVFSNVYAEDLGVLGKTYPIAERNLLDVMQERMQAKVESGEVDALHQSMSNQAKSYAKRPKGISLPRATQYKATPYIPTYTVPKDIKDDQGNVLYAKGATVNALDVKPLTKTLCFFDGDDAEQLLWVQGHCLDNPRNKLILTQGEVFKITEQLKTRVYFDQRAYLVNRFSISHLPTVVRQSGKVLYVEAFPIQ